MLRCIHRLVSLRDLGLARGLPGAWQRSTHVQAEVVEAGLVLEEAAVPATGRHPLWVPVEDQRLLQAAVVGAPNAGKSTLTNALVGSKVSAVSAKTNTTVHSRLGAFTQGSSQVVLFDTPGVVASRHYKSPQHQARVQSAWRVAQDTDVLLFLVDAHRQLLRPDPRVLRVVEDYGERVREAQRQAQEQQQTDRQQEQQQAQQQPSTASTGQEDAGDPDQQPGQQGQGQQRPAPAADSWPPALLLFNKVDEVPRRDRPKLLPLAQRFCEAAQFKDVFYISALHGHGLQQLKDLLFSSTTPGEWLLEDPGAATDRSPPEVALEVVREKLFQRLYKELPYRLSLAPVGFNVLNDGSVRVEQDILVPTSGARKIVVGRQGAVVGSIGALARAELQELWGRNVHLYLNVKQADV